MKRYSLILITLLLFFKITNTFAAPAAPKYLALPKKSDQLVIILTNESDEKNARLQRYVRDPVKQNWVSVGKPIPVILNKPGIASTVRLQRYDFPEQASKEHIINTLHHHLKNNLPDTTTLTATHDQAACSIPSSDLTPDTSFSSKNIFAEYHPPKSRDARNKCIFSESCKDPAGCVEINKKDLKSVLAWLDPDKEPVIALLPETAYHDLEENWKLPDELYIWETLS